ncbi:hypothetical protein Tsubulata_048604 [Turnera subulata]|uniref:Germin-like protein n=1 Tax=Turnera subulata TaxID=218843 RepID=A0A9Q0F624_9ROSI|nr:hypothetical protein Tsubulata_048604 [Turnera subulata]
MSHAAVAFVDGRSQGRRSSWRWKLCNDGSGAAAGVVARLVIVFLPDSLASCSVTVNGLACRNPAIDEANDFSFSGLHIPGNTSNPVGSKVTPVTVSQLPGLSTLSISMARIDFAPWGINPPHTHPRASEILTVIEGSLKVGFVTSNPENRLVSKVLEKGDVFVFPEGLVHFQQNVGYKSAVAVVALSSENPGVIAISNAVFGANPKIPSDILAKAFQLDRNVVGQLQWKF